MTLRPFFAIIDIVHVMFSLNVQDAKVVERQTHYLEGVASLGRAGSNPAFRTKSKKTKIDLQAINLGLFLLSFFD